MLEHLVEFTAWPILTGILVGYVANRIMSGEGKGCCKKMVFTIVFGLAIFYTFPKYTYLMPSSCAIRLASLNV